MGEGWSDLLSYRPSDFLMFSPRIYGRLFESINRSFWPAQAVFSALALLWLMRRRAPRIVLLLTGVLWLVVAWAFLFERLAPIHWVATWFAAAFAATGVLLAAGAGARALRFTPPGPRSGIGLWLLVWSLLPHPLLAGLAGRPWTQAEVVGLAPDPTAIATLGLLLLTQAPRGPWARWWWPAVTCVPLAWCLVSAATLATMGSWQAVVPLLAAALAGFGFCPARR